MTWRVGGEGGRQRFQRPKRSLALNDLSAILRYDSCRLLSTLSSGTSARSRSAIVKHMCLYLTAILGS